MKWEMKKGDEGGGLYGGTLGEGELEGEGFRVKEVGSGEESNVGFRELVGFFSSKIC